MRETSPPVTAPPARRRGLKKRFCRLLGLWPKGTAARHPCVIVRKVIAPHTRTQVCLPMSRHPAIRINQKPAPQNCGAGSDCQKSRFAKNNAQKVFARLFRKGGGVKGRSPWRVPQDAKSFAFIRIRKGDATARWAVASWETLSRGFPMRRLTPHLCSLLFANQFFDTLTGGSISFRPFQSVEKVLAIS